MQEEPVEPASALLLFLPASPQRKPVLSLEELNEKLAAATARRTASLAKLTARCARRVSHAKAVCCEAKTRTRADSQEKREQQARKLQAAESKRKHNQEKLLTPKTASVVGLVGEIVDRVVELCTRDELESRLAAAHARREAGLDAIREANCQHVTSVRDKCVRNKLELELTLAEKRSIANRMMQAATHQIGRAHV